MCLPDDYSDEYSTLLYGGHNCNLRQSMVVHEVKDLPDDFSIPLSCVEVINVTYITACWSMR